MWYGNRCTTCSKRVHNQSSARSLPIRVTTRPSTERRVACPTALSTCTSVLHLHLQTSCTLDTNGCMGYLLMWMVRRGMRARTSIAHRVAHAAPTNHAASRCSVAATNGTPFTRPPKEQILMMTCARPQPLISEGKEAIIGSPFFYVYR